MTDNVTPMQASKSTLDIIREWLMSGDYPVSSWEQGFADAIDNRITDVTLGLTDKIATQSAEIARLKGLVTASEKQRYARCGELSLEVERLREALEAAQLAMPVLVTMLKSARLQGGAQRAVEVQRTIDAALSAQPSEQPVSDEDDLPEVLANCETCRAIIRDGDVFVMDDYCVCLCRKCMADEQEGGE